MKGNCIAQSIISYHLLKEFPLIFFKKSTLIASEATKEGKIEIFQEELDGLIMQTGTDVTALGMKIRDPDLLTVAKSESVALKKLQDLEEELKHLSNSLKDYSSNGEHLASQQRELKRKERYLFIYKNKISNGLVVINCIFNKGTGGTMVII